jgi:hypothetical protein
MRWVVQMGEKRNAYRVLVRKADRDYLEDLGIEGRTILKWILYT